MKVTIKDIAQTTGFSLATVSLVLNNRPSRISDKTKEYIHSTARDMGYLPNSAAVSLKTRRSYTLGLIIPDIRNDYYANYAKGLEDACQDKGWTVILCSTNFNPERELKYIETLCSKNIDGLSLAATPTKDSKYSFTGRDMILSSGIPLVQMDLTGYQTPMNAVVSDHAKGGYMATKHLLSLGHRQIAFITGPSILEGSQSRLSGCQRAFADYKIPWNDKLVYMGNYTYSAGLDGVDYFSDEKYTAIFAFNDLMACGVFNGLAKYNLSVPADVSVVGYDDHFVSNILSVPLTTIRQPIYEMGKEAANILINAAEDEDAAPVISNFDLSLIVRESTRKLL